LERFETGFFAAGDFAAARLIEYAIATLWAIGFPAATSALMFLRKASLLVDFTSGIIFLSSASWQSLPSHESLLL
jgi:hypothetical protein